MSWVIDFFTNFFTITGNSTVDTILFTFIGIISLSVAFDLVGMIFDSIGHYDSDLMSGTHWLIRIIVFIVLSIILRCIFKTFYFLFSFKWYVYLIIILALIALIVFIYFIKYKLAKKNNIDNQQNEAVIEKEKVEFQKQEIKAVTYNRDYCPRCGGKLVKRHGPYGDFYGCDNYSSKNCRYTRRYK